MIKFDTITSPQKYIEKINFILKKYLPEAEFFLFGSRVNNLLNSRSDFDFAIVSKKDIPLNTLLEIKSEISELPTLFQADVVDLNRASEIFKKEALKTKLNLRKFKLKSY